MVIHLIHVTLGVLKTYYWFYSHTSLCTLLTQKVIRKCVLKMLFLFSRSWHSLLQGLSLMMLEIHSAFHPKSNMPSNPIFSTSSTIIESVEALSVLVVLLFVFRSEVCVDESVNAVDCVD